MLLVSAHVGPSAIHGTGCFTNESIKQGQLVWVLDRRIDVVVPAADLCTYPQPYQEFLLMYGYQAELDGEKVVILCSDHSKHMNHADNPNIGEDAEHNNVALRDIAAGEELTCNYYSFDLDGARKLCH